jgi:hypothetical protein
MSFDGAGTYNRVPGSAYTNGTVNDGSELDAEMNDLATALSLTLPRDGQAAATGNLPMGGYKLTGAGAGSSNQDSIIYAQAIGFGMVPNLSLTATVGSSALTVAVKGRDGNDPSATNPVLIPFRSATLTAGTWTAVSITSALSVVVSSGSTLGRSIASTKGYLFVYLINNSGTAELAISGKYFGTNGIVTTTAEGGAGAADSSTTMYSTTARVSVAYRCIAMMIDTQTTAGTWAAVPTDIRIAPFTIPETAFRAHRNAAQLGIAHATPTKLALNVEAHDIGGDYDNATNYRFVAPMPGLYQFTGRALPVNPVDTMTVLLFLYLNGAMKTTTYRSMAGTIYDSAEITTTLSLNTHDYVELWVQHNLGINEDFNGLESVTSFECIRVGTGAA